MNYKCQVEIKKTVNIQLGTDNTVQNDIHQVQHAERQKIGKLYNIKLFGVGFFFFTYILFVLYHIQDFYPYLIMRNVTGFKKGIRNWLPFKSTWVQPRDFLVVSVLFIFLVLCVVYFLSCLSLFCILCPVLCVSLYFVPSVICVSVFCAQCYVCLCILCPVLYVSLYFVPSVMCVSVFCAQYYMCLCILCPVLYVSLYL